MKKRFLTVLLAGTVFVVGCGSNSGTQNTKENGNTAKTEENTSKGQENTLKEQQTQEDSESENQTQETEWKDIAKNYMEALKTSEYEKLKTEFPYDDAMKKLAQSGSLETSLKQIFTSVGNITEVKTPFIISNESNAVIDVPCRMEKQNLNFRFTFHMDGKIAGIVTMQYAEGEDLDASSEGTEKAAETALPEGIEEREAALNIENGWTLPGTLTVPKDSENYPIVILVHGSGNNDRNEMIGENAPFRDIAWELAKKGIAVYRYDKRTLIYPEECCSDINFTVDNETVDDAAAAAEMVKTLSGVNTEKIFVLGHSLGAEMIPRIAERTDAAGYIMMASPARSLEKSMEEQIEFLSQMPNITEEQKTALEEQKAAVEQLKQQIAQIDSLDPSTVMMGNTYPAYWSDLTSYNPIEKAKEITKPVLLLQGEEDYQVTMESDYSEWEKTFANASNWTLETFPGLTHLFMEGTRENGSADYVRAQHVDESVINSIAQFILK